MVIYCRHIWFFARKTPVTRVRHIRRASLPTQQILSPIIAPIYKDTFGFRHFSNHICYSINLLKWRYFPPQSHHTKIIRSVSNVNGVSVTATVYLQKPATSHLTASSWSCRRLISSDYAPCFYLTALHDFISGSLHSIRFLST